MRLPHHCIFVYGSLRRAGVRHDLLAQHCQFLGLARIPGRLYWVASYPGLIDASAEQDWVIGEVYKMHDPELTLRLLDEYEECSEAFALPHEYVRELKQVQLIEPEGDGELMAWVYRYCWPVTAQQRIHSGDFMLELLTKHKA